MRLVRNLSAGLLAGAIGTAAMDVLLYERYRRDGGKDTLWRWEFAGDVMSWDDASAPGQLGRKALRLATGHEPPDEWARPTTNIMHWVTGIGWGMQYGALATRTTRHPWVRALALGPAVWLSSYLVLPLAKVYKPIWDYDARTLGNDLSAHIVYGAVVSTVFQGTHEEATMSTSDVLDPQFRTIDRLRIRYADSDGSKRHVVLLTSPWPESIHAFAPMWATLAEHARLFAVTYRVSAHPSAGQISCLHEGWPSSWPH